MDDLRRWRLNRRALLAVLPAGLLAGNRAAAAAEAIGEAADVRGRVTARQVANVRELASGAALLLQDAVETAAASFARLELAGRTTVHLGSGARLLIDRYVAEQGGVLELGEGALLIDRAEDLPKIDLSIRSQYGLIALRGTKVFAGPSRGVFGVCVLRGAVEVSAAGEVRQLQAGDGVDIAEPGGPPSAVGQWKQPRIAEALASVGL
jgi:hypothetical protein